MLRVMFFNLMVSVIMLNDIVLSVIMLNVVWQNVVAPPHDGIISRCRRGAGLMKTCKNGENLQVRKFTCKNLENLQD